MPITGKRSQTPKTPCTKVFSCVRQKLDKKLRKLLFRTKFYGTRIPLQNFLVLSGKFFSWKVVIPQFLIVFCYQKLSDTPKGPPQEILQANKTFSFFWWYLSVVNWSFRAKEMKSVNLACSQLFQVSVHKFLKRVQSIQLCNFFPELADVTQTSCCTLNYILVLKSVRPHASPQIRSFNEEVTDSFTVWVHNSWTFFTLSILFLHTIFCRYDWRFFCSPKKVLFSMWLIQLKLFQFCNKTGKK